MSTEETNWDDVYDDLYREQQISDFEFLEVPRKSISKLKKRGFNSKSKETILGFTFESKAQPKNGELATKDLPDHLKFKFEKVAGKEELQKIAVKDSENHSMDYAVPNSGVRISILLSLKEGKETIKLPINSTKEGHFRYNQSTKNTVWIT